MNDDENQTKTPPVSPPPNVKKEAEILGSVSESTPEVTVDKELKEAGVEVVPSPEPAPHEIIKGSNVELPSDTPAVPVQAPLPPAVGIPDNAPSSISIENVKAAETTLRLDKDDRDANRNRAKTVVFERKKLRENPKLFEKAA